MRIEKKVGVGAGIGDDLRAERQVGDKVSVHDVQMNPVGSGFFDSLEFASELAEIPRENGRCNDHAPHNLRRHRPSGKILKPQHDA